jgi:hypothetical protein
MIAGGLAVGRRIEDGGSCLKNAKLRCDAFQRQRLGFGLCAPDRTISPPYHVSIFPLHGILGVPSRPQGGLSSTQG